MFHGLDLCGEQGLGYMYGVEYPPVKVYHLVVFVMYLRELFIMNR